MSKIIQFPIERTRKPKPSSEYSDNLTKLLKRAVKLTTTSAGLHTKVFGVEAGEEVNGIFLMNTDLKNIFQRKISEYLLQNQLCDSSALFKCSLYVSDLIADNLVNKIKSYHAIDFFKEGVDCDNPWAFKEGADLCFLLCAFFEKRTNYRSMRSSDYYRMGTSFYAMFYAGTKMEIGCHMSRRYSEMVDITKHCIKAL